MGILGRLKDTIKAAAAAKGRDAERSAAADEMPLWKLLDSPDSTHMKHLKPDYVPVGLFDAMITEPRSVLDVGCFCGGTGAAIKARWPNARVVGIEPLERAAGMARGRLDHVFVGRFEDADIDDLQMPDDGFDAIICADVLEHMYNPWAALETISTLLAPDGVVIASIPNARNLGLIADIACHGRWQYQPAGLLDITHIRWFTLTEIDQMFAGAGLQIEAVVHVVDARFADLRDTSAGQSRVQYGNLTIENVTLEERQELSAQQFVVRASLA